MVNVFLFKTLAVDTASGPRAWPAGFFGPMPEEMALEAEHLRVGRILRPGEACVRLDREFRVRESATLTRVLPEAWTGIVSAAVAAEIEAAGAGHRLAPMDGAADVGEAGGGDAGLRGRGLELVRLARAFTYELPDGYRTLPVGWAGYVARDIARAIEDDGAGRILREGEAETGAGSRRRARKLAEAV